ncbi:RNA 2',3'-cyclic phosphodiesterase [Candidatus Uhrbacteria bacterium]|jgi:2'-5' RNA ligase|nr:RNA 2',3'-cyclic phosphodiesterase [Candidatus Uhrbacteria bacterium]
MKTNTKNIFFAFELPESAIQMIEAFQHDLRRNLRGPLIRWTSPEAWHVKTHHVGEATEKTVQNLRDAMSLFRRDPVEFSMWSLDVFPNIENPKKLVLRFADPTSNAFKLHGSHIPMLLREAIKINTRPWEPHITLGRIIPGRSGLKVNLSEIHVPQQTFPISKLTLFESFRGPGVRYEPIRRLSLPRT